MGWYVIFCKTGQEETIIRSCKKNLSKQALEDAFQFSYERMKKYLGQWHVDTYRMFPNYVFLKTSRPELLSEELKQYREITNILESDGFLMGIEPEEERMIHELCGEEHHLGISRGIIQDGALRVLDGPLTGCEPLIRKIDLHKRIAVLDLKVTGKGKDIWAGLDIVK